MELIRGLHNLAPRHRGCVVSIGSFDGMHRGHQALIARLHELSAEHALPSTVLTFEPTPREFFARETNTQPPPRIASFRGKLRALERAGVERVLCLRFDRRLAALSAEEFIDRILVEGLGVRAMIVGEDFHFGAGRGGDLAQLRRAGIDFGFSAEGMACVNQAGERCSSTSLRRLLAVPDLGAARAMLGREFRMLGRVRHGLHLGRALGMPTANLNMRRAQALAHGVYAVRVYFPEEGPRVPQGAPAVASFGVRPTLGMTAPVLETYVFDFSGSIYGMELEVEFHRYLRPQLKFDSMDQLAAQMQTDGQMARSLLEKKP